MSYTIYKRILITFFVTFTIIFILTPIVNNLISIWGASVIWSVFLYVKPFLSITLLYFGVYSYMAGVKTVSRWERPIAVIIMGLLFVLLAYAPPLLSYKLTNTDNITSNSENFKKFEANAVDNNVSFDERRSFARLVYVETGKVVRYLNEKNILIDYMPDKSAEEKRKLNVKYEQESKRLAVATKNHVTINLLIALTLSLVFVVYLIIYRHTKKASRSG